MNALTKLNHLCQIGVISTYSFREVGICGEKHKLIFKIVLTIFSKGQKFQTMGRAGSKKKAKSIAATQALDKIGYKVEETPHSKEYSSQETAVSYLDKMAQRGGFASPCYSEGPKQGPDHCPIFTINIRFREYEAQGTGYSKKAAKENAAQKLKGML